MSALPLAHLEVGRDPEPLLGQVPCDQVLLRHLQETRLSPLAMAMKGGSSPPGGWFGKPKVTALCI